MESPIECAGYYVDSQCVNLCLFDAIVVNPARVEACVELLAKDRRIHAH